MNYHVTQAGRPFARTNRQTIEQRADILRELGYRQPAIAEICCGDCRRQQQIYQEQLQTARYCGLDLSPEVVALNRANGVACLAGDALDTAVMRQFLDFDVIFFGPPSQPNVMDIPGCLSAPSRRVMRLLSACCCKS
ncbi:MAG: hypothetical protein IPM39_09250 [Chloroflexi bacterium]|nr:hypothetical protein [Chloroflexota bacterium]